MVTPGVGYWNVGLLSTPGVYPYNVGITISHYPRIQHLEGWHYTFPWCWLCLKPRHSALERISRWHFISCIGHHSERERRLSPPWEMAVVFDADVWWWTWRFNLTLKLNTGFGISATTGFDHRAFQPRTTSKETKSPQQGHSLSHRVTNFRWRKWLKWGRKMLCETYYRSHTYSIVCFEGVGAGRKEVT